MSDDDTNGIEIGGEPVVWPGATSGYDPQRPTRRLRCRGDRGVDN
jgi:hypothetical protein